MQNSFAGWISLIGGIAGASLLSFDTDYRNLGYFFLLVGCFATLKMMYHSEIFRKNNSIFLQSLVFTFVNLNGIYQFFLK